MKRFLVVIPAALVLLASCGGDASSSGPTAGPSPSASAAPSSTAARTTTTAASPSAPAASPAPSPSPSPTTPAATPTATLLATATATLPATATAVPPTPTSPPPTQAPPTPTPTAVPATPTPTAPSGPLAVSVTVSDNFFSPRTVTVAAGGSVTWTWTGNAIHDITGSFGTSGLQTSGSFSATFSAPGTYAYACTIHQSVGMTGSVIVQ